MASEENTTPGEVTRVLGELAGGDSNAARELLPLVYDELRTLADQYLRDEPRGHTLQPTALVHELYIRLVGRADGTWENRARFFGVAAQAMRHLLIDHARRRRAAKRGAAGRRIPMEDVLEPSDHREAYLIALDDALKELMSVDPELGRVVELRFFGGLSVDETARVLGCAPITVKRKWKLARGWLHREITDEE